MIPRSRSKLSREECNDLIGLIKSQPWLEEKYDALQDVLDLCCDFEEQSLLTQTMRRFKYLNGNQFNKKIQDITNLISNEWCLAPNTTKIVALHNDASADSAQLVVQALKGKFATIPGWQECNFVNSMPVAANNVKEGTNIVLVDEFIGTGYQSKKIICKCYEYLNKRKLKDVKLYLSVVSAMSFSRDEISKLVEKYEATIWLDKGISDHFEGTELENARNKMQRIEEELCSYIGGKTLPSFGKGNSETLYGYEMGNAPANVFPIFWWRWLKDKSVRQTLLSRISK